MDLQHAHEKCCATTRDNSSFRVGGGGLASLRSLGVVVNPPAAVGCACFRGGGVSPHSTEVLGGGGEPPGGGWLRLLSGWGGLASLRSLGVVVNPPAAVGCACFRGGGVAICLLALRGWP